MQSFTSEEKVTTISDIPEVVLGHIFSFLQRRYATSVLLTCRKFAKVLQRPKLQTTIMMNLHEDYHFMNIKELHHALIEKPHETLFILKALSVQYYRGVLNLTTVREIFSQCSIATLLHNGYFFEFKHNTSNKRSGVISALLKKIVCNLEYYSGKPEYTNPLFACLIDTLSRSNININDYDDVIERNIIILFQHFYISLPNSSHQKTNLSELLHEYFVISPLELSVSPSK